MYCSNAGDDEILTLGLGSCVALVLTHPPSQAGAMAHIALPYSKSRHIRTKPRPDAYFADLAIPRLIQALQRYTGPRPQNLEVSVVGGASMRGRSSMEIGAKNLSSIVRNLAQYKIVPHRALVGGHLSRNVRLQIQTGTVWVKEPDTPERILGSTPGCPLKNQLIQAN